VEQPPLGAGPSAQALPLATRPHMAGSYGGYHPRRYEELPGQMHYRYMWWGFIRDGVQYDFASEGDKGQLIYVSPRAKAGHRAQWNRLRRALDGVGSPVLRVRRAILTVVRPGL
jgi:hypothetical protein